MTKRRGGPRFILDSPGNLPEVRQTGHVASQPPPDKPPGNGGGSQSRTRPPQESGGSLPHPVRLQCGHKLPVSAGVLCEVKNTGQNRQR